MGVWLPVFIPPAAQESGLGGGGGGGEWGGGLGAERLAGCAVILRLSITPGISPASVLASLEPGLCCKSWLHWNQ